MGNDSNPEASWRTATVTTQHAITPSIIFGPFQSDSCSTFSEVTHRRGQELVTGTATEPYNGWTKQEGLMTYQLPAGNWLLTCTQARWNGRPWHSWPTFIQERLREALWDVDESFKTDPGFCFKQCLDTGATGNNEKKAAAELTTGVTAVANSWLA